MIKNITGLLRIWGMGSIIRNRFCSKADILKTYLEIIPPHKIYEMKEKKEHKL
jgi:hypothetical protein